MTPRDRQKSPDALDNSAREFVLWLLDALGLQVQAADDGVYQIELPRSTEDAVVEAEHPYAALAGRHFAFDQTGGQAMDRSQDIEYATWQSPLVQWLLGELQPGTRLIHASAAHQPLSVHELAEHLFAQYKVDHGHMHLAGCSLEDRPFLRLSYLQPQPRNGAAQLVHCFGTSDGELMDPALSETLDLDDLVPVAGRAPRIDSDVVRRWTDLTRRQFEARQSDKNRSLVAITVVWCKHVEGKLTFSIGQRTAEVPFSGWGRLFADRRSLPPPYQCPLSGKASYHLGATDDGRITVAEAIATCDESSRRVLADELQVCAVTGRRVLPEYLRECPCTGEQVLGSMLQICELCQQQVSPQTLAHGRCSACRQLESVSKADPGLARVLDTYPKLDRLRRWKMAETRVVQTFVGNSAWKRLLVVFNKQTLEVLHMANSSRLSSKWNTVTAVQRAEWLD